MTTVVVHFWDLSSITLSSGHFSQLIIPLGIKAFEYNVTLKNIYSFGKAYPLAVLSSMQTFLMCANMFGMKLANYLSIILK